MKILLAHTRYRQRGGEDSVVDAEIEMLRKGGHDVVFWEKSNEPLSSMSPLEQFKTTISNPQAVAELGDLLRSEKPDVVHFHNTFQWMSPAVVEAAHDQGFPVVQTLHNYRLLCCNGVLYRDGAVCEQCVSKSLKWPGVLHACYRSSKPASLAVAMMLRHALPIYRDKVHRIICITEFSKAKHVEGGLTAEKIAVKSNFIPDPGVGNGSGNYALFIGRFSVEKGIHILLEAWSRVRGHTLKLIGDGPLESEMKANYGHFPHIEFLGAQPKSEVIRLLQNASLSVLPSVCYEGAIPMTVIESLACGTPCLSANLGGMPELNNDPSLVYADSNSESLSQKSQHLLDHPEHLQTLRKQARGLYESRFTEAHALEQANRVYADAISARS
ncbi:MAG: glycosyltransferase family 4 protein [Armatimonadetes bacterium]|nr:glycosyltransferase family 4 protein [Armatimonadota bacterium]